MDDYRDVERFYRLSLEKIILDAGLKLPGIYGLPLSRKEYNEIECQVKKVRDVR